MISTIVSTVRSTRGASAIEYALIASMIAVAAIAGMKNLGSAQGQKWNQVDNKL